MEEFSHTMAKYITRLNSTQKDLQALRSDSDRAALLRARIIGYESGEMRWEKISYIFNF